MRNINNKLNIPVKAFKGENRFQFEEPAGSFPMLTDLADDSNGEFLSPVKIDFNLYRVNDMFRGDGSVETSLHLQCSRCLENFVFSIHSEFALNFTSEPDAEAESGSHAEYEINAEQVGLVLIYNDEIDLIKVIQEQIIMALPIRPLCREDCRGLCPQCGADLNKGSCRCEKVVVSPKFQSLANFDVKKKTDW